ncbi:MAG: hypothetical protein KME20_12370 [Kaiparowitsia implicata GSE-PSE-MK54-09C]|jgi:DNA-binding response OmpR family regulator|nr:hypothetical protein [Kaiparowitsia implicata GSE-PSE-MK54-09C]
MLDKTIQKYLHKRKRKSTVARDYSELIELVDKRTPSLMIVEPLLYGGSLCGLREKTKNKNLPVMIVTSLPANLALKRSRHLATIALINKPCDLKELYNILDSVIGGYSVFPDGALGRA